MPALVEGPSALAPVKMWMCPVPPAPVVYSLAEKPMRWSKHSIEVGAAGRDGNLGELVDRLRRAEHRPPLGDSAPGSRRGEARSWSTSNVVLVTHDWTPAQISCRRHLPTWTTRGTWHARRNGDVREREGSVGRGRRGGNRIARVHGRSSRTTARRARAGRVRRRGSGRRRRRCRAGPCRPGHRWSR